MSTRDWMRATVVAVVCCFIAARSSGQIVLEYEGSFKLPNAAAWSDYYYGSLVYVPDGTPRPGWSGTPVSGPSLIAYTSHVRTTKEFNQLPPLSKSAAGMGTAVLLPNDSGGTEYKDSESPTFVDGDGNLWFSNYRNSNIVNIRRDPGVAVLGGTASATAVDTGWPRVQAFMAQAVAYGVATGRAVI